MPDNPNSQLLIYRSPAGDIKIDVRLESETVWLTQKLMAELFQTSVPNINMHLKSIYEEDELDEAATIKDFLIVQKEGGRDISRTQKFFNLDAIISVGYRIKSQQYLAFAEAMAQQRTPMHMKDWITRLDVIIQLNGRELLNHAGQISHEMAVEKSAIEF